MHERLAVENYLLPLSMLGVLVGIISGLSMVAIYVIINSSVATTITIALHNLGIPEQYCRAFPPLIAITILITFFSLLPKAMQSVGIIHILDKLNNHKGDLPPQNALVQFFAIIIGLTGGLSIGKEGPEAHIGAAFGCKIAKMRHAPIQHREVLIACGVAGAIAAAFHTPLAGVLFALEVILLSFHTIIILPLMLSSVAAMVVSKWLLGPIQLFRYDQELIFSLDTSNIIALGLLALTASILASIFLHIQKTLWSLELKITLAWRFLFVGIATSVCAIWIPETLGVGYQTLETLLTGGTLEHLIITVLIVKLLLTAFSIGLGIPGGVIGPLFVIGGLAGAQVALWFFQSPSFELVSLFILLGMATMMSASLQAPLAGLIGVIELNSSSNIILPAMLVIGVSCVITRTLLKQDSIFIEKLKSQGKNLPSYHERHTRNKP
ncbi:chloride channel protein [Marinomonas agarivorans]|nr:chloride channel protein [Marinomonas agarivorans]